MSIIKTGIAATSLTLLFSIGWTNSAEVTANTDNDQPKAVVTWEQYNGAHEYQIYRSENEKSGYKLIDTISDKTQVTYEDTTVEAQKTYYYKIKWSFEEGNLKITGDTTEACSAEVPALPENSDGTPADETSGQKQYTDEDIVDSGISTDPENVLMLVNKTHGLSSSYVPSSLVYFGEAATGQQMAKPVTRDNYLNLFNDAKAAGYTIKVVSAYRSYWLQEELYSYWCSVDGVYQANRTSAKPGKSEHQTGYALDVSCASEGWDLQTSFGSTPEGQWISQNAHKYGFIVRYGATQESITGYAYEPWHIRYVGVGAATDIYNRGITLEEYLG